MDEMEKTQEEKVQCGEMRSADQAEIMFQNFPSLFKKALRRAIADGDLGSALGKVSDSLDLTKSAVESIAQVVEKAREKLNSEGKNSGDMENMMAMGYTWLPMFLGLIKTQEFQNLTASMLVSMLKDK
ncbi:MAG: hypothetical protein L5655_01630 [Thermosediminibacteraceae bacterium]|nr:hypothetical protein [Thermosediminibacteraceae bacterium]